jgi:hypothetical protein
MTTRSRNGAYRGVPPRRRRAFHVRLINISRSNTADVASDGRLQTMWSSGSQSKDAVPLLGTRGRKWPGWRPRRETSTLPTPPAPRRAGGA